MDGYLINGSVGIPRGSLLRIDEGKGVLVYVWQGELWLTSHLIYGMGPLAGLREDWLKTRRSRNVRTT